MKIDSKTTVTVDISVDELKQLALWALKQQSVVPTDADVDFTITQDVEKTDSLWTVVPPDWQHSYCPDPDIDNMSILEVELRDGTTRYIDKVCDWSRNWYQESNPADIVRYRVVAD